MCYWSSLRKKHQHVSYLCVQFDTLHAIISVCQFLCLLSRAVVQGLHRSKSSLLTNLWVLLQQCFNPGNTLHTHLNPSGKYTYHTFQHSVTPYFTHLVYTNIHRHSTYIIHYTDSKFSHSNNRMWNNS